MDWDPIKTAIVNAISAASGVDVNDIRLATDKRSHAGTSFGKTLLLDLDQTRIGQDYIINEEDPDTGLLIPVQIGERELGVQVIVHSDDHRVPQWAHVLAHRLQSRMELPHVTAILDTVFLVLRRVDTIVASTSALRDFRDPSVAVCRIVFGYTSCERADEAPVDESSPYPYFDKIEVNDEQPCATSGVAAALSVFPDLPAGDWGALWIGYATDVVSGHVASANANAALNVPSADQAYSRVWSLGPTDALITQTGLDVGQLVVDDKMLVLVMRAPAPATSAPRPLVGRHNGTIGWELRAEHPDLIVRVLGTGGTNTGALAGHLDNVWRCFVLTQSGANIEFYGPGNSVIVPIAGLHTVGAPGISLSLGAVSGLALESEIALIGEIRADDPSTLRADVAAAVNTL